MRDPNTQLPRLLSFRAGGWVILASAAIAIFIIVVTVGPAISRSRNRPPGDGKDPTTYGFDLTTCLIDREDLTAGQLHRDIVR